MPVAIDYTLLPEHLRAGMRRYFEHGIAPGSFLRAALENDLAEAWLRADAYTRSFLLVVATFLQDHAPPESWGSVREVQAWIERHHQLMEAHQ